MLYQGLEILRLPETRVFARNSERGEHTPLLRGICRYGRRNCKTSTTVVVDDTGKIIVSAFPVSFGFHKYLRRQYCSSTIGLDPVRLGPCRSEGEKETTSMSAASS